jgi:glycosyltransferase involved in cell wall biosynthesis
MARPADPVVSIVIPCWLTSAKQVELLDETLSTVAAQMCQDYETIVVDDGSPLDPGPVAGRYRRTVTLRQVNRGPAAARNHGISVSRGGFLVFLDADDHLLPPALERGLQAFAEYPDAGFVVGPREEMTYEGAPVAWDVPLPPLETHLYNTLLGFDWYIIPPSSAMFRSETVTEVGGFRNPWGADDLDFYLRVARRYAAHCYHGPPVTRYRRYSASSSRDGARMLHSVREVYDRQRPLVAGDPEAQAAFDRGLARLTEIFADCLVENVQDQVRDGEWRRAFRTAALLARESPRRLRAAVTAVMRGRHNR